MIEHTHINKFCTKQAILTCFAVILIATSSKGLAQVGQDQRECWKPYPPFQTDYETPEDFGRAKEEYFSQATHYISCLDDWVREAEIRYREMFNAEIETYASERDELLSELKAFTQTLNR